MSLGASSLLLLEEVRHANGRKGGSLVDDGCVVDLFVDTDGLVKDGGLDGLSLDHGLDCKGSEQ